jgi:hypothetical protein
MVYQKFSGVVGVCRLQLFYIVIIKKIIFIYSKLKSKLVGIERVHMWEL